MRLHRFYINQKIEKGADIRIESPELLHQWIKVFRLSPSDKVILFDGSGKEFDGYFRILSRKEAVLGISKERKVKNTVPIELHLFQSIIKKDNFELIIQKCTELGVSAFHPIISERSEKKDLNMERLLKISIEASEQSGRVYLPEIFEPLDLETAINNFDGQLFALDFDGQKLPGKFNSEKIGILIGPEGGWSDNERKFLKKSSIKSISIGQQILRAETAAIAISSLMLLK
jgi:16S rRNA (uracil1498-N3)-methyltransferase